MEQVRAEIEVARADVEVVAAKDLMQRIIEEMGFDSNNTDTVYVGAKHLFLC